MNPLSGVIGDSWRMYRAHALHLIAIAFAVYLAAAILDGIVSVVGGLVVTFLGIVISLLAGYFVQAALVKAVQDVRDGRVDLSITETLSAAVPSILPVAAVAILASFAITIGFIFVVLPGLYLITIWAVIVPVVVIERASTAEAFGRSRQLVRGRGWHVFATLVVVWILSFIVNLILGILLSAAPLELSNSLSTLVSGTLVAPFIALIVTLMYYRLLETPAPPSPAPPSPASSDPASSGPA